MHTFCFVAIRMLFGPLPPPRPSPGQLTGPSIRRKKSNGSSHIWLRGNRGWTFKACHATKSASLHYRDMDCAKGKFKPPAENPSRLSQRKHPRRRDTSCRPPAQLPSTAHPTPRHQHPHRNVQLRFREITADQNAGARLLSAFFGAANEGQGRNLDALSRSDRYQPVSRGHARNPPSCRESCFERVPSPLNRILTFARGSPSSIIALARTRTTAGHANQHRFTTSHGPLLRTNVSIRPAPSVTTPARL